MILRIKGGKYVREFPTDQRNYDCNIGRYVYL